MVKEKTCFKSIENPSCIDLFLTNHSNSFQSTTTIASGLSDFHKLVVTVLKTTFSKAKPQVISYRSYKHFDQETFRTRLRQNLEKSKSVHYTEFESIFLNTLDAQAPLKKKTLRANHAPYMTKTLRKAIMRRSALGTYTIKRKLLSTIKPIKNKRTSAVDYIKKSAKNIMLI